MKIVDGLIGGLAGAISITLIHEAMKRWMDDAPRMDLLGEEALQKGIEATTSQTVSKQSLYIPAMAGDLVANALYYGLSATRSEHPVRTAGLMGVTAGLGAITLPDKMGLNEDHSAGSLRRKLLTVGLYTAGGLITGWVVRALQEK